MSFDGNTFEAEHDRTRLTSQLELVRSLMSDGKWRTLWEISQITSASTPSVSARLRDLRKPKFGGYTVERRRMGDPKAGLFEYRVLNEADQAA